MNNLDGIDEILRSRLEETRGLIAQKEAELNPYYEEEKKLQRMLREYESGSKSSRDLNDEQIVLHVRHNSDETRPIRTTEIASGLGIDPRGLSKRLPRMARDGMLAGNPEDGYYVSTVRATRKRQVAAAAVK